MRYVFTPWLPVRNEDGLAIDNVIVYCVAHMRDKNAPNRAIFLEFA
jgi:hypothetical protein